MTTTGKSALRRKRFTKALFAGYQGTPAVTARRGRSSRDRLRVQNAHIRQVPVALAVIQAVADHELVRDLEAGVADPDVDLAAAGFRQERADLERRGRARLECAHKIRQRQARVDDVLDDQHVPALDVDVEILEDADD